MIKKLFFQKTMWISKNAEFDAYFESVEKLQKAHAKKVINKKWQKN